ncbi:unnamed protein product, partial [marine sediment metagenome]
MSKIKLLNEQYIIDKKGNKKAVVLPYKKYEGLLEDLHDLSLIAERKDEDTISTSDLKDRLKANG